MEEGGEWEGDSARERTPRKCEHFGLWRGGGPMVAALGGCGLQPNTEALKHFSLFKSAKMDPSARVCEAYSDPCWSLCVYLCAKKKAYEWIHCTYCFPCSQAASGISVWVCEQGKRCVRLYLESLQTPSSPLSSPLSVLSARRICQFSFSVFVPALILLSKPWLALLTAAEHRSYSFSTNNTHSGTLGWCVLTHTRPRYSAYSSSSVRTFQNR